MKIGIITVYKGSNYGAFLQAFALQNYLQESGNQVWFIRHFARTPFLAMCKKVIVSILRGEIYKISFLTTQENRMQKARKLLKEKHRKDINSLDVVILGSDEIWNIKRKKIYKYPFLFGKGIHHSNKISYAPSVNMSSIADFNRHPKMISALKELKTISVRDEYSKNIIMQITGKNVQLALDPTLLMSREFYRKHMQPINIKKPFILVYSYGTNKDNKDVITELVQYAHDKNLVLVSIMGYLKWCDYNIGASPFEVLSYFNEAEFIITDTFHGTVFSLIFEQDFIIPSVTSRKLDEILNLFNVKSRVISESDKIEKIISSHINYNLVNQILYEKVKESKIFLNDALRV